VIQSLTPSPHSDLSFSARACAINAATLASLDAGSIAIKKIAVAVSLAFDPQGHFILDPDAEEEVCAISLHGFAWAGDETVWIESEGQFTREQVS
jgi:ribonuclease PH